MVEIPERQNILHIIYSSLGKQIQRYFAFWGGLPTRHIAVVNENIKKGSHSGKLIITPERLLKPAIKNWSVFYC